MEQHTAARATQAIQHTPERDCIHQTSFAGRIGRFAEQGEITSCPFRDRQIRSCLPYHCWLDFPTVLGLSECAPCFCCYGPRGQGTGQGTGDSVFPIQLPSPRWSIAPSKGVVAWRPHSNARSRQWPGRAGSASDRNGREPLLESNTRPPADRRGAQRSPGPARLEFSRTARLPFGRTERLTFGPLGTLAVLWPSGLSTEPQNACPPAPMN
jgi:hypothetical protein